MTAQSMPLPCTWGPESKGIDPGNACVFRGIHRGNILDIKALARAIGEGKVAAAGLDALPDEGSIQEEAELLRSVYDKKHDLETMLLTHILLRLRNVIITPHSAFNTREAVERIRSTTVGNIAFFSRGEPENVLLGKQR